MNEVGFYPVVGGVLSCGVLSVWGFVLWGFVHTPSSFTFGTIFVASSQKPPTGGTSFYQLTGGTSFYQNISQL